MGGEGAVAFQVLGDGPDLLYVSNWMSNLEIQWDEPAYARFLDGLASFSRLICFDKRGSGLSEAVPHATFPSLEEWMDDILTVMDAAGSERAALVGCDVGGMLAMLFAASHPERVSHLVLVDSCARMLRDDDYPVGIPEANTRRFRDVLEAGWGDPQAPGWLSLLAPRASRDPRFRAWFSRMERLTGTPAYAATFTGISQEWDLRPILPSIRTPTLVLHHQSRTNLRPGHGRYLAEHIAGARYLDLPGEDAVVWREDAELTLGEIGAFVTGARRAAPETDRVLATVLFTDIVGSTEHAVRLGDRGWRELLDAHDRSVAARIDEFRGRPVKSTGDGVLATFDSPARAIRCAAAVTQDARDELGIEVRAGVHTGEVEVRGDDIGGISVHTAARVMAVAGPGEVVLSRTVKDLVAGSGLAFDDRGSHELKGLADAWELFALRA